MAKLEWAFIANPQSSFERDRKTALCVDGVAVGKIAAHGHFFYPITTESKTSEEMFATFEGAQAALEEHATGGRKLMAPVISISVPI